MLVRKQNRHILRVGPEPAQVQLRAAFEAQQSTPLIVVADGLK